MCEEANRKFIAAYTCTAYTVVQASTPTPVLPLHTFPPNISTSGMAVLCTLTMTPVQAVVCADTSVQQGIDLAK